MIGECGLDESSLGNRQMAGCWEHVNELSGFVKCGEFLGYLTVSL